MLGKKMIVLLAVVLMLMPASGIFAQEGPHVYCGTLADADCEILMKSQEAMKTISSTAFAFGMDMAFSGSEEAFGMDPFELGVQADGQFAVDSELAGSLMSNDPEVMAEMMAKMPEALAELLRSVSGDLSLSVDLPAEVLAEMGDIPALAVDLVMVGGVLYVDISPFTEAEMEMPAWMGVDIASLIEGFYGEMMAESGMSEMMDMQVQMQSELMSQMTELESLGQYIVVTRGADDEADGVAVAVFTTTIDYAGIFSDEAFRDQMMEFMAMAVEAQGESLEDMPENFWEVIAAVMEGIELQVVEKIGLADFYTRSVASDMAFDMDVAAIAEMTGEDMSDVPENFSMTMSMALDFSNINAPVEVVAPADAQVIDPMMFLGAEMGGTTTN